MANFFKSLFSSKKEENSGQQKQDTKNFEIFKYDGLRAQRMGRMDYAIKCFQQALEIERDFETMNYLSQAYIQTNQLEEAKELLMEMIEAEPSYIDAYLVLGNVLYMLEDYKEMAAVAQKAVQTDPTNHLAFFLQAKACHKQQNDLMAIAYLTQALTQKDDFVEGYLFRAEILLDMKQLNEMKEDIEAVFKLDEENENARLLNGKWYAASGKAEDAEKEFRSVLELNPFNEQAYLTLGELMLAQNQLEEAINLYNDALDMNPNLSAIYRERGRAKLMKGDKAGSMEDVKKAMELDPKAEEAVNGHFDNQERAGSIPGVI